MTMYFTCVWTMQGAFEHAEEILRSAQVLDEDGMDTMCPFGPENPRPIPKFKKGDDVTGEGRWLKVRNGVTLDSGCSVFVIPSCWLSWFSLEESEGSKRGQNFTTASNNKIPNEGQRTVRFITDDGRRRRMTFQVSAVNKILASVAGICDNGNTILFTCTGGTIKSIATGRETKFRRQGNVYVMDIWVANPSHAESKKDDGELLGFSRQGLNR